jgi:phosphoserine aminotransferase
MKNTKTYFTPGPSELYFTAEEHIKQALKEKIPSISHRSKAFEGIYQHAVENIQTLLNLPDNYKIVFTGSATEIWERLIQNCVENQSYHLVNGSFSKRFYEISSELGRKATKLESTMGSCPDVNLINLPEGTELIAFTQNETSTGAALPVEDIYATRKKYPQQLITVDVVSALPYINLDYTQIDSAYFSVQKGFGLPAGLGVWMLNERCIEKSQQLAEKGLSTGSYHSITSLLEKGVKNQTPETPNVLGIYLLGKVAEDMNKKGIDQIRKETEYKAAVLYNAASQSNKLSPFVKEAKHQSKTVVVLETTVNSKDVINSISEKGLVVGSGYGGYKEKHLRIANFPTHSKEQVEQLADYLTAL